MVHNRQNRLRKVFDYLVYSEGIKTQGEFAERINVNKTNLSSAMNGNEKYLSDSLFQKIHSTFPALSIKWLLTGDGNMLNTPPAVMTPYPEDEASGIPDQHDAISRAMNDGLSPVSDASNIDLSVVPIEIIEEIREEVKEEIREEVIEEIREEVKEEIKQEEAIAVIPVDIANQVDVDIKKYIEENESELEKLTPSDLTGDVDGVEKIRKDSMSPTFVAGDRIFIKFLKHKSHIVDGEIYYFNLRNRPTMIRQVKIEGDKLRLIAFNSQYSDIVTDFNNVLRVADVNGMYRSFFSNQSERRKKDEQIDKLIDQNAKALESIGNLVDVIRNR